MTPKFFPYAIVGLSAIATALPGITATAHAQTTAQPPVLASFALTNSNGATFNGAAVTSVAPTTISPSLQSAMLMVTPSGPGPAPGLTKSRFFDDGYGTLFTADPSNQPTTDSSIGATTDAGALQVGSYFSVNLAANTGTSFMVGALQFDAGKGGLDLGQTGTSVRGYDIRSSVDNYSVSLDTVNYPGNTQPAPATDYINLTGIGSYQSLSAITFRFYIWTSNPPGTTIDFRNIVISSSAAPEPGDFALLLIGLAPMALVLRRRQKKQA